jgi:Ca2+-transporting ATPase
MQMSDSRGEIASAQDEWAEFGLTSEQALWQQSRDGPNAMPVDRRPAFFDLLVDALREPMLALLVVAAALYFALGDLAEATVLCLSVVVVVSSTVIQRGKTERALDALRDLSSPQAAVYRDGALVRIDARKLVVGDLIFAEEGDRVPADCDLLFAHALTVDESLLTGESMPVSKTIRTDSSRPPTPGQTLYSATLIVSGQARARVRAVGAQTQVGRIGTSLGAIHTGRSPTQQQIDRLVLVFAIIGLSSCVLVTALFWATRGTFVDALLAGITLAIANVPEEFPLVLTIFLALGAWRLARAQVLVRRPPAIETLGAISVLCVDKTGTLTENRMAIRALVAGGERWQSEDGSAIPPAFGELLRLAALAGEPAPTDPMELAIGNAAGPGEVSRRGILVRRYPLSAASKARTYVWRIPGSRRLLVACKGAPEAIAELCRLDAHEKSQLLGAAAELASSGLRVLAVARAQFGSIDLAESELPPSPTDLHLDPLGLIGFSDPLRGDVPRAVAEAQAAGVRVVMITGDHPATARSIAAAAGIDNRSVLSGDELSPLDDGAFGNAILACDVFARVSPDEKLRLVRALRNAGEVVAMTGDGVNDGPALKCAHVGIAMGRRGTDVAREAAQVVLLDDRFASIVGGIRLGRTIYANIQRALRYILAVHVPVAGMALLPLLFGGPLVLSPVLVVFLELIIDPSCTLVFERQVAGTDVMGQRPRARDAPVLGIGEIGIALAEGAAGLAAAAAVYAAAWQWGLPDGEIRALTFSAIVGANLALLALNRDGNGARGALRFNNPYFWIISLMATLALLCAMYLAPIASIFRFASPDWWASLAAFLFPMALATATRSGVQRARRLALRHARA